MEAVKGCCSCWMKKNDMQVAKLNLRQGQEYRIPQNCSMRKMIDLGVIMIGEISDALYSYLAEASATKAEVVLTIKVVG